MSALPTAPSPTPPLALREAQLVPMRTNALAQVLHAERAAYDWPWTEANIADSIAAGYQCLTLVGSAGDTPSDTPAGIDDTPAGVGSTDTLLGYFIAMHGVDEVHLLNITVAPPYQRQGWARVMLDALALWSRSVGAQWLWLEVRVGNARAITVYEHYGFRRVGERKRYYPAGGDLREDAIVMSYKL
jgi:[ribosomal protein S18]-alanine N-acetyltransferase